MKKQLLFASMACLFAFNTMAQITIGSLPPVLPNVLDSFSFPLSVASVPSMAPATNGSWDLDSITLSAGFQTSAYGSATPAFSIANFADSVTYFISPSAGIKYKSWRNMQQSSTGVVVPGEEIVTRQALGLGSFTSNILDSIVFPLQAIHYNNALPVLKFPATLGTSWSGIANRQMNFDITINLYSYNHTPAQNRQIRRTLDSVVGWGRMQVPRPAGGGSDWIQVLQVQHTEIVLDSFFLAAGPVPTPVLTALGLSQGQTATHCSTYFYRAGELRPLAAATHSGPTFTSAPSTFYMHAKNLPAPLAISSVSRLGDISIYPNPVRNGLLHINLPTNNKGNWTYTLINVNGQVVASDVLLTSVASRSAEIALPNILQPGIYYITLTNNGERISVLPITIE